MAITYLQQQSNRLNNVTSVAVTISAAAGTFLVVSVMPSGGSSTVPISSVTDSSGANTWHYPTTYPSTNPPANNDGGGDGLAICYSALTHAVTSVTVNVPSSCAALTAIVAQFSGVSTTSPFVNGNNATSSSTPTLSVTGGNLAVGAADTSNATAITGMTTILVTHGNCVGYAIPGSTSNESMSWTPSQTGATGIAQFLAAPTIVNGTATLTETETLTALATTSPTASLIETESLVATPGAIRQLGFSVSQDPITDNFGNTLITGISSYNYASGTARTYDYWISAQSGQLVSGGTGSTSDVNLYRASAAHWATDNHLAVGHNLTVGATSNLGDNGFGELQIANAATVPTTNPTGGGVLYAENGVPTWRDSGGFLLGMVRSYQINTTGTLANFTTATPVPGGTAQVVVHGTNATILVNAVFDIQTDAGNNMTGQFSWNGTLQTTQAILVNSTGLGTATNIRATVGQNWMITGVTAGTYPAVLYGTSGGSASTNEIRSPHTSANILVIDQ